MGAGCAALSGATLRRTCVRTCPAQGPYPFNLRTRCAAAIQGEVLRSAIMIRMLEVGINSPRWLALLASAGYLETILNEAVHVRRSPCLHCLLETVHAASAAGRLHVVVPVLGLQAGLW